MSTKKGKKSKNKIAAPEPTEWDALDITTLETTINEFNTKLKSLQNDRNYWQNECNTVQSFSTTTIREIDNTNDKIYLLDQEIENVKEEHRVDLQVYSHKVKHLNYDHERTKEEIIDERNTILKSNHNDYNNRVNQLKIQKMNLKEELKEHDIINASQIQKIKKQHKSDIAIQKIKMDNDMIALQNKFKIELDELKKEMELNRKISIHDVEERNNSHIYELQQNQIRSKERLTSYYESIINENSSIVQNLQEELVDKSEKIDEMKHTIESIIDENEKLQGPLITCLNELSTLEKDIEKKEKHELTLINVKNRIKLTNKRIRSLEDKIKNLTKEFNSLEHKRDTLYQNVKRYVTLACERNNCKSIIVEHTLKKEKDAMDKSKDQLWNVAKTINITNSKVMDISFDMRILLDEKEDMIERLQLRIMNARKSFANDILQNKISIMRKSTSRY